MRIIKTKILLLLGIVATATLSGCVTYPYGNGGPYRNGGFASNSSYYNPYYSGGYGYGGYNNFYNGPIGGPRYYSTNYGAPRYYHPYGSWENANRWNGHNSWPTNHQEHIRNDAIDAASNIGRGKGQWNQQWGVSRPTQSDRNWLSGRSRR